MNSQDGFVENYLTQSRSHVADVLSGEARWLLVHTEPPGEVPAN